MTADSWKPLLMVEASAGSGKTTKLIARYVELLRLGGAPETILATSFSRKAAQEIFTRLIAGLYHLASSETPTSLPGSNALFAPEEGFAQLRKILRNPNAIPIGTVDSFAQRFARLFFLELGLSPEWSIPFDFEYEALQEEVLHEVLKDFLPDDRKALFHVIVSHESTRSVFSRLFAKVSRLQGIGREKPEAEWEWDAMELLPEELRQAAGGENLPPEDCIALLESLQPPTTKGGTPNKRFVSALLTSVQSLRIQDWSSFLSKGIPKTLLDRRTLGGDAAPSFSGAAIPPEWCVVFEKAVNAVVWKVSDELVRRTSITARFIKRFQTVLLQKQLERSLLGFSDVKNILRSLLSTLQYQHLAYRLDRSLQHILLDEFQDTTPAEWDILNLFVAEIANADSVERSVCIVGDPKQSIYGWRGGDAALFDKVRSAYPHFAKESLNKSYRSSPIIIDFVNALFFGLSERAVLREYADVVRSWCASFEPHEAAKKSLSGYVAITPHAPEREGPIEERVAEEVSVLLSQNPHLRIALLVRKNKEILPLLLACVRRGVEVSAEGGSPLTDSSAVVAVLHLLHAVAHPHDTRSRYHVEQTPIGEWLRERYSSIGAGLHELSRLVEREGLSLLIRELLLLFTECSSERDRVRGERLLALALQFDGESKSSLDLFIRSARRERMEEERAGVVRIMTIHRSKGLEFDAVFLPNLAYDITRVLNRDVLIEKNENGEERVLLYANQDIRKALPALSDMYRASLSAQVKEELSVLYVAVTRARSALYMFLGETGSSSRSLSSQEEAPAGKRILAESLIREFLPENEQGYRGGDAEWYSRLEREGETPSFEKLPQSETPSFLPPRESRAKFFPTISPTHASEEGIFVPTDSFAIRRGELIHRFFEQLDWLGCESQVMAARSAALRWWRGERAEGEQLLDEVLERVYASDALLGCFLKERARSPEVEGVFRELPFVFFRSDESGRDPVLVKGVIDRFVLYKDGSGDLFDFKTGGRHLSQDEILHRYSPQVRIYEQAVTRLLRQDEAKAKGMVRSFLCLFDRGEVVQVS